MDVGEDAADERLEVARVLAPAPPQALRRAVHGDGRQEGGHGHRRRVPRTSAPPPYRSWATASVFSPFPSLSAGGFLRARRRLGPRRQEFQNPGACLNRVLVCY